ncbi:MAG TPA: hypothetical protein VK471_11670 [Solirubrobacterales bacterium]|nr:hypothetical protein [Solirubrobacterales bacterium]
MSESFEPIRSYQRIFAPERRIHQLEGHSLPIPGGVPLRWLAYATGTLLAVIVLSAGSSAVALGIAAIAALAGFGVGGREGAAVAAIGALGGAWLAAIALGLLDLPLRLIVIPAAVATLGTQATPDGRRADRFALSWLSLRLSPLRRSLGRSLPLAGLGYGLGGRLWVEADERLSSLRRARVRGPAVVFFSVPIAVRRASRRRHLARPPQGSKRQAGTTPRVVLGDGEVLEVRP